MFGDGYFSISFEGLTGIIVTILGIWLVVRQLRETKQANQLLGLMALGEMDVTNGRNRSLLLEQAANEDWYSISDKEAHDRIFGNVKLAEAGDSVFSNMELVGMMVRKNLLHEKLAYGLFGKTVWIWWDRFGMVLRHRRTEIGWDQFMGNWEWLAKRFKDYEG